MSDFRFEKLAVWQKAIDFADRVYNLTSRFPHDERFGLTNQMRRAAVSISSNIAEGSGRGSDVQFGRFLEIAYGSLMEVVSQTHLAARRSFVSEDDLRLIRADAEEISRMLSGLRPSLQPH